MGSENSIHRITKEAADIKGAERTLIDLHSFVGIYPNSSDGFVFIRARNRCFLYTAEYPPQPGDYPEEYMFTPETKELTNRFHSAAKHFLQWLEDYEAWIDNHMASMLRLCFKAYHLKCYAPQKVVIGLVLFATIHLKPSQ